MTAIWRLPTVQAEMGKKRSALYEDIRDGLMVKPVPLGKRAVGFPANEVRAINAARIAGAGEEDLRKLVTRLHAERLQFLPTQFLAPHVDATRARPQIDQVVAGG